MSSPPDTWINFLFFSSYSAWSISPAAYRLFSISDAESDELKWGLCLRWWPNPHIMGPFHLLIMKKHMATIKTGQTHHQEEQKNSELYITLPPFLFYRTIYLRFDYSVTHGKESLLWWTSGIILSSLSHMLLGNSSEGLIVITPSELIPWNTLQEVVSKAS